MGRSARFAVLGILAVLGTLSITRLPRFAIYANERDAARLVRSLAVQLESESDSVLGVLREERGSAADVPGERWLDLSPELRPAPPAGPPERAGATLVARDLDVSSWARLPDLEWLPDRGLLRRHGYLFRARRGPQGVWVEAWPWDHGQTGLAAFRQGPRAPLEVHPNLAGHWSGVRNQPPGFSARGKSVDAEASWRTLGE